MQIKMPVIKEDCKIISNMRYILVLSAIILRISISKGQKSENK